MDFIKNFQELEKAEEEMEKLKLRMNQQVLIVKNVVIQWCLKWDDMESSWHAAISQIAVTQNQLSKKLV